MEPAQILTPVIIVMVAVTIVIVRNVCKKISEKADSETRVNVQEVLLGVTLQSISLAEQISVKYRKANNEKIDSDYKLEIAVEYVINEIRRLRLPELSTHQIQEKVEAYLGIGALNKSHNGGDESAIFDD